ncbi:polyphosphoinositide phosphatase-like [Mizuhopecten yessoensis]|uniref:polyphosphoinositide phosphatase-like n=1 Tax=Mizuhopecten yessoensis TaxID=6573 RepID=UPI000B45BBF9|nr:polyphosphoinositide phosphatase-like [Mizuhopecten yessoensis]
MECPIISRIQKVILYETKARFYVVGSNKTETCYRVLKVDRTEPKELIIQDDKAEYSMVQIRNLLTMIKHGNINKDSKLKAGDSPLAKSVSAFGIFGFVRFLEGYYIILITKRRKAAILGPHIIYKIEDTAMIYIPNDNIRSSSYSYSEEQRYLKMFQSIDLSSNFYFSYSYDLTHTLQYNMTTVIDPVTLRQPERTDSTPPLKVWGQSGTGTDQKSAAEESGPPDTGQSAETTADKKSVEDEHKPHATGQSAEEGSVPPDTGQTAETTADKKQSKEVIYGVRSVPEEKYVWNHFLQRNCKDTIHRDWMILVTHGFVDQRNICVYGKPLYLTLIARRSNQFAGTRFLKRGANCKGEVANEVETEQILHDASITFLERANITSFVQMRGSVPLYWSQDVSKMVPKPPIMIDQIDPYAGVAGRHFNEVLKRYGAPAIILNLVKKKEKRRHESILTDEYKKAVNYLNQFLSPQHALKYISFDMAHISKNKDVLLRMVSFAGKCVKLSGLFVHRSKKVGDEFWQSSSCLYILGVLKEPKLEFDTVCTRMLEQLYEDQGDTIALQYGGSQLVHRIEGYRKTAPWTSHSKDIMNTISRYYSNTFADLEKQQATNVFLGVFEPVVGKPNIWELPTDFYLHNKDFGAKLTQIRRSYSQWWEVPVYRSLPLPWKQVSKPQTCEIVRVDQVEERVNLFEEYYRTTELTFFQDIFTHSLYPTFSKDVKPRTTKSESPFTRRVQPEQNAIQEANPNVSGKDSTSSTTSTGSESSESSSDEVEMLNIDVSSSQSDSSAELVDEIVEETQELQRKRRLEILRDYGFHLGEPRTSDMNKYKRYVNLGRACLGNADLPDTRFMNRDLANRCNRVIDIDVASVFKLGSSYEVEPPPVNKQDQLLYQKNVMCGKKGATNPSKDQIRFYKRYISKNLR